MHCETKKKKIELKKNIKNWLAELCNHNIHSDTLKSNLKYFLTQTL